MGSDGTEDSDDEMPSDWNDPLGDGETIYATRTEQKRGSEPDADEPKYRNEEWLRYQYHVERKSGRQIADEYGYGSSTIHVWIEKHGIEKRDQGDLISEGKTPDEVYTDRDWLYAQYHQLELSIYDIAERADTYPQKIHKWLQRLDIETRDISEANTLGKRKPGPWNSKNWLEREYVEKEKSTTQIASEHNVSSHLIRSRLCEYNIPRRVVGAKGQAWKSERNYTDHDWLHREYIQKERPATDIAEECNVSADAIAYWLSEHDIPTRSYSESMELVWGKKNAIDITEDTEREFVSEQDGTPTIDSSWRYFSERTNKGECPIYRNEDWLRERYYSDGLTLKEIASLADVTVKTIVKWMDEYKIERRPPGPRSSTK